MRMVPRWVLYLCLLMLGSFLLLAAQAQETENRAGPADVWVMTLQGPIGPAVSDWFTRTLSDAEEAGANLLVLELDTPGGLDSSMRDMIQAILNSDVPVATYVTPGVPVLPVLEPTFSMPPTAAMAPATNLGSATPVQIGGGGGGGDDEGGGMPFSLQNEGSTEGAQESEGGDSVEGQAPETEAPDNRSAMEKKVVNDAVAYIRGLAELRGRNADWAEAAVREAVNLSSSEALERNVIDIRADTVTDMLEQADGREVDVNGVMRTLNLKDHKLVRVEKDWRTEFLSVITNPSVAYILMLVGIYGLILEFYNPGMGVPGVVGGISLLVALYALQMLPISYVGLGLILLGIGLMAVEAFSPSFGILGGGGAVSFIVGSIMLMDTDVPAYQIAMPLIAALAVTTVVIMVFVVRMALQVWNATIVTGQEGWRIPRRWPFMILTMVAAVCACLGRSGRRSRRNRSVKTILSACSKSAG